MSDQRLTEIEMKLAYVEQTNTELSAQIYAQQRRLERLEAYCKTLAQRLAAVSDDGGEDATPGHEVPPHY